jgi:hypothetical protein
MGTWKRVPSLTAVRGETWPAAALERERGKTMGDFCEGAAEATVTALRRVKMEARGIFGND